MKYIVEVLMRVPSAFLHVAAAVLLSVSCFPALTAEPDMQQLMVHNRELRLLGANVSMTRALHLIALFARTDSTNTIQVNFSSGPITPHRVSIERIIKGAIDWESPGMLGAPMETLWYKPKAEVVFSAPTNRVRGDFSEWFLVSLEIRKP